MVDFEINPVIAAIRTKESFDASLSSEIKYLFLLNSDILTVSAYIEAAHKVGKKIFIHVDFTDGLGKDKSGMEFVFKAGADGVISTRTNIVKAAKECGLLTVQRFFIIDSHSVDTAVESIKVSRPDMIEIMPGVIPKTIAEFTKKVKVPVIAGGLIEAKMEIYSALSSGAVAVSTSKTELW
ncbi:MAG: glycerol-3-phosphate responsive antiterminator [Bacillota bacterium]|nr:glycerol-3-phosphate responsive antiterminator [Bacillota bacterium]